MRHLLPLAVLLAMTWPQMTVMSCTATLGEHAAHAEEVASEHTHDGPVCTVLMACASAMIEGAATASVVLPPTPPALHPAPAKIAHADVDLPQDPPPPRRLA